jgi:hypothetical protein
MKSNNHSLPFTGPNQEARCRRRSASPTKPARRDPAIVEDFADAQKLAVRPGTNAPSRWVGARGHQHRLTLAQVEGGIARHPHRRPVRHGAVQRQQPVRPAPPNPCSARSRKRLQRHHPRGVVGLHRRAAQAPKRARRSPAPRPNRRPAFARRCPWSSAARTPVPRPPDAADRSSRTVTSRGARSTSIPLRASLYSGWPLLRFTAEYIGGICWIDAGKPAQRRFDPLRGSTLRPAGWRAPRLRRRRWWW